MQQLKLFSPCFGVCKTIQFDSIKANFVKLGENMHEVLLEINSNKFLVKFDTIMDRIEQMEIMAVKGFVELSVNIIRTIKKIITKLYFEF